MDTEKKLAGFEKWLDDFRCDMSKPPENKLDGTLSLLAWNIGIHEKELMQDSSKTQMLLNLISELRASNCVGRQIAERKLMEFLSFLVMGCCEHLHKSGLKRRCPNFKEPLGLTPREQEAFRNVKEICSFAIQCFHYSRPRDSFGGRRRAMAVEILACAGASFDLPEAVNLARQMLSKKKSEEANAAASFFEEYYAATGRSPDEATVKALQDLSRQAGSHTVAMNALNALIQSGKMSETEALFEIEDWKERNWR